MSNSSIKNLNLEPIHLDIRNLYKAVFELQDRVSALEETAKQAVIADNATEAPIEDILFADDILSMIADSD